ncbi:MAG: hypothetical protein L0241_24035 [Planctomycetia bacterium]|nr:hypothetical protein [Planctomycetia bacterium]
MARVNAFLNAVREWVAKNERVARVFITAEGSVFKLHVTATEIPYDFALRHSLTDFVLAMTDRGYDVVGSLIPDGAPDELAAFLDLSQALILCRQ